MKKQKETPDDLLRVALYIRVSGEEQKIKGLSLEAQEERLVSYAKERGWLIVGTYIDAAKTARKNIHKRLEFQRMIEAVRRDEVDMLLFCRLDRWFRSVADYYKVMEILEAHNCAWRTTDEEYDTTTANGRLYINVKLSIAQNEADIDGERIEVIFDSKIAHGTVLSGGCPFGFRINEEKRLEVVPEKAAIVQDAFDRYEEIVSKHGTITYIREKYGVNWCDMTFQRMLAEKLYTGVYDRHGRFNDKFCPPIISNEQFERVQNLIRRNARSVPSGRVYMFTSILVCDECRHKLVACRSQRYFYYRCNMYTKRGVCTHSCSIREDAIEAWLFSHLEDEINRCQTEWEVRVASRKRSARSNDRAALKRKLSRLKDLYVNEMIDIEEYRKDFEIYTAALQASEGLDVEETPPNLSAVRKLLDGDFKATYSSLTRVEKRSLWRSVIREIRIDNNKNITAIFFT